MKKISLLLLPLFFTACTKYVEVPQKMPIFGVPKAPKKFAVRKTGHARLVSAVGESCTSPSLMMGQTQIFFPVNVGKVEGRWILIQEHDRKAELAYKKALEARLLQYHHASLNNNKAVPK